MKNSTFKNKTLTAFAALLLAGASQSFAQSADLTINTFDTAANNTGHEWGPGTQAWDGTTGNPPDPCW